MNNYENGDSNGELEKHDSNSIVSVENKTNDYGRVGNNNEKLSGSSVGYVLGLIGSTFSFIICFFAGIGIILFQNLFGFDGVVQRFLGEIFLGEIFLGEIIEDIYDEFLYFDTFLYSQEFLQKVFDGILKFGIVLFVIILIGFILGIIGTIKSWKNVTIASSSLMIVGGIFSLFCLILPGILLIVGGGLNMKCAVERLK